jgi:hypothetical protein
MKTSSISLRSLRCFPVLAAAACVSRFAAPASAQPLPPFPPNPLAPTLKSPAPMGMQRGTTLDLTLTGSNLADPTGLWTSFPAKVAIPKEANNGKDPAKLLVRLEVPKDAPLGFHALRLATLRGVSNLRLFCIDDLPQVLENATNHTLAMAQPVTPPCVVVGRADAETTDYFKVAVKAGQRLSFEILGRRLGSAFDPQLTLYDARTGREVPAGHSNDAPGLQTDARLTHTFKDAGDCVVGVRDVAWRGGEDFNYRLRIGDFPTATTPLPLAARRGAKTAIRFSGPNADSVPPVEVNVPSDPNLEAISVSPRGSNGPSGWPVSLAVSDLDEVVEQEPNNEPAKATRVPVPGAVTGRFQTPGDLDHYVFALKKGTRYAIEAQTHEYHSPSEVLLTLRDARGGQVQASNPAAAPRLDYTPPADGDYTLVVEHLFGWGGPDEVYRVSITPYEPGFDLLLSTDRLDVAPGGTVSVPVYLVRRDYNGAIEIGPAGVPGITGKATIAAGAKPPPNQPAATLTLTAVPDLAPGPRILRIEGKATINGKAVVRLAEARRPVSVALANLPVPPRQLFHEIALGVTEKPPFSLTAKLDQPTAAPGKPATLTVTVTRAAGFTADITLAVTGQPPNVAPVVKPIPANQNSVQLTLNLAANAPAGQFNLTVNGKAKHAMRDYSVNAPAAQLVIKK